MADSHDANHLLVTCKIEISDSPAARFLVIKYIERYGIVPWLFTASGSGIHQPRHVKSTLQTEEQHCMSGCSMRKDDQRITSPRGHTQGTASASCLAEISVRSPRKSIIFIIYKQYFLAQSIQKIFNLISKTEALETARHIGLLSCVRCKSNLTLAPVYGIVMST